MPSMGVNQPRRPAGTLSGGQWAPAAHDEADVDLSGTGRPKRKERGDAVTASSAAQAYIAANDGPPPAGPVVLHLSDGAAVTVDPGQLDDLEAPWAQAYLRGHCFDLAVALHQLTGGELIGVVDDDMADRCPNGIKHVGVSVEKGLMLDIEGPDTELASIGDDDPAVHWRRLKAADVEALAAARGPEHNVPLARAVAEKLLDAYFEDWREPGQDGAQPG